MEGVSPVGSEKLRLALPSKGRIDEQARQFFDAVGFSIRRPNARQYVGSLRGLPDISVLFQRASDVVSKVETGLALAVETVSGEDTVRAELAAGEKLAEVFRRHRIL